MSNSVHKKTPQPRRRRLTVTQLGLAAAALALGAFFATMALASSTVTIGSAASPKLDQKALVTAQGRTLYALSPETATHLLCKSTECLSFWPPLTVPKRTSKIKLAAGVHGTPGILHRGNGTLQVTLNGQPLYRYSGDHANGEVNGQDLKSFGGTWHALSDVGSAISRAPAASTPAPTSTTTQTTSSNGYEY